MSVSDKLVLMPLAESALHRKRLEAKTMGALSEQETGKLNDLLRDLTMTVEQPAKRPTYLAIPTNSNISDQSSLVKNVQYSNHGKNEVFWYLI